MSQRGVIITALEDFLLASVTELVAERIHRGSLDISKAQSLPIVFLTMGNDKPAGKTDNQIKRDVYMAVTCLMKIDESKLKTNTQLDQLDAVWAAIHATTELFSMDPLFSDAGGGMMDEDEEGQIFLGLNDKDRIVAAACGWNINYIRTFGAE